MIYFLVLFSCTQEACHKQVVGDGFGLSGCLVASQQIAAQWKAEHPKHKIKALRCVARERLAFELNRDWT
jgi:hypothetical protein